MAGMGILSTVVATNITPHLNIEKPDLNRVFSAEVALPSNSIYRLPDKTWSNVVTAVESSPPNSLDDISMGLDIINQLAFIEGDSEAEQMADNYFDSVKFTSRKVIIK